MNRQKQIVDRQIIDSDKAIAKIQQLCQEYAVNLIVIGDGTTSATWCEQIKSSLTPEVPIVTVNEKNSTLEARDRYWTFHPPRGLQRIIPQGLRIPPRPVDDIVAILLIERYLMLDLN